MYNFGEFFPCNALNLDRGFKVRNRYYLKSSGDFGKCENINSSRINSCSFGSVKLFKSNIVQEQHISNKGHIITLAAYDVFHNIFLKAKFLAPQKTPGGRKDIARPCRKYVQ